MGRRNSATSQESSQKVLGALYGSWVAQGTCDLPRGVNLPGW